MMVATHNEDTGHPEKQLRVKQNHRNSVEPTRGAFPPDNVQLFSIWDTIGVARY